MAMGQVNPRQVKKVEPSGLGECLEHGRVPEKEIQRMIHFRKVNQLALSASKLQKAKTNGLNNREFIASYH